MFGDQRVMQRDRAKIVIEKEKEMNKKRTHTHEKNRKRNCTQKKWVSDRHQRIQFGSCALSYVHIEATMKMTISVIFSFVLECREKKKMQFSLYAVGIDVLMCVCGRCPFANVLSQQSIYSAEMWNQAKITLFIIANDVGHSRIKGNATKFGWQYVLNARRWRLIFERNFSSVRCSPLFHLCDREKGQ